MSNSINTDIGKKNKEIFEEMIKISGYENIRQFCKDVGIDQSNLYSNLDGTWKMSLGRMFKVANMLGVPIEDIIKIFYPQEYAKNRNIVGC